MSIKIFADGADLAEIEELAADPRISGFTTNPTLMRKAGVKNYEAFCRGALELIGGKPISFEVFSDDFDEMHAQALRLSSFGEQVYVKIPVTNTKGTLSTPVIRDLSKVGVKVNVTAVFTSEQVQAIGRTLVHYNTPAIVSVFAGRIADTGRSALHHMTKRSLELKACCPHAEMLWASPRQAIDIIHAGDALCDIITVTRLLLNKMALFNKDLDEYSLETVKMFYDDAKASGYSI